MQSASISRAADVIPDALVRRDFMRKALSPSGMLRNMQTKSMNRRPMIASRSARRPPARRRLVGRTPVGRRGSARHAFTLLELLLVLAILVVLAGFVAVNVVGTQQGANVDATTAQLANLKNRIKQFQLRMNGIPQTLEELRDGPSDAAKKAKWVGPIIEEIPKDAWGNDLDYKVNGNGYELRSAGVDGQMSTEDDIVIDS